MKKIKSFSLILSLILVLLPAAIISSVDAHSAPYPLPSQTYEPVPEPITAPSPNGYVEEDVHGNVSSFGGLDSNGTFIAVGNTSEDSGIRIYNGDVWHGFDLDFTPTGIEWSKNDDTIIFVSDNESDRVFKGINLSQNGATWIEIGSPGTEPGQFIDPHGMFSTKNNELYVVDTGNNRIQFWNGTEWLISDSPQYSEYMVDICISGDTTYITDNSQNCIYYKTREEQGWNVMINPTYINYPSFMDMDEDGNIYFISWVIYPEGPQKNIVRFSNGIYSVYVETGDGPGYINNEPTSEELCLMNYGGLLYSDSTSGSIYRELCSDTTIQQLTVNSTSIDINEFETNYEIYLDYSTEECLIEAVPKYSYSSLHGTGNIQLNYGSNIIPVTCVSESGTSLEYKINIIRDLSTNAQLSEILFDGNPLSGFDPDVYKYNEIGFPLEKENVEISGTPLNPESILIGTGTIPLSIGENPVLLTVIAKNGINIQYYLLNIIRSDAETDEITSESPKPSTSPVTSASPSPSVSPSPTLSPTPIPTIIPVEEIDIPINMNPTETPPIDHTPTPEPTYSTQDPNKDEYEKDLEKEIEKDKLRQILTFAGIAIAAGVIGFFSYNILKDKKKNKKIDKED